MKAKAAPAESSGQKAAHERDFQAWKAKQPTGSAVTSAAYKKANPKAAWSGPTAAASKVEAFTSQTSAMDFLSLRQEIVREPRSAADV
jgi:hypothetical protein